MAESENIRKAREKIAELRAREPEMERLRNESKRLAEEMDVLQRAAAIMRDHAQKRAAK